jgi:hypothetical protein
MEAIITGHGESALLICSTTTRSAPQSHDGKDNAEDGADEPERLGDVAPPLPPFGAVSGKCFCGDDFADMVSVELFNDGEDAGHPRLERVNAAINAFSPSDVECPPVPLR